MGVNAMTDIRKLLERVESIATYAQATVSQNNWGKMHGEWVEIHAGRAKSSEVQLSNLLTDVRALLETPPEAGAMTWSQLAALNGVLDEIEEYLGQREDIRDGSDGQQLPNEEMSLLSDLRWWRSVLPKSEPQREKP